MNSLVSRFAISGDIVSIKPLGEGFINDTYKVTTTDGNPDYLLQRKNHNVFPDVPAMMDNIVRVTAHLRRKVLECGGDPLREVLTVVPLENDPDKYYFIDEKGNYWTICQFIEGSVTIDKATSPDLAKKGGQAIGRFQTMLSDFNEPLADVIPGFHNIRYRFNQWDAAVKNDAAGRVKDLATEIAWIEERRDEMLRFWQLVENGELPRRVTHNDTKLSNILFDQQGEPLCMIDLDTVMLSTSLNDFGDAIRSYANTGAEDDQDLSRVGVDMEMYRAFHEGYVGERKDTLTPLELELLPFSARYITFEQVLRFLMDYIEGDHYYKIAYPEHNLVRTRAQYQLLQSMEAHL